MEIQHQLSTETEDVNEAAVAVGVEHLSEEEYAQAVAEMFPKIGGGRPTT
ncbi:MULTISPECIES: hypothetical protein [Sorangium]|uniref:Uncharacterized protein n=1 Tax=Sorangium cellulosum TaxID=56 RepID=A0A4P2QV42_SORCE|nr:MULTISPECIES: hypothetical protein [Sorangium]AUX34280.1 uncharacterized protein SOCE836_064510 [Sorangium cellulosum]WCQ93598.1 hypothetical protein NQZ70_06350 [Sorangium sp. Soce836]